MTAATIQNEVFNRTTRVEIPISCVRREVKPRSINFKGLIKGEWSSSLEPSELAECVVHVDVRSVLLWKRETVDCPDEVFKKKGCSISVPPELTNRDYRVKLQVTISFPAGHAQAGRILARSSEIIVVEGPEEGNGTLGASILPVRPAADDIPELWRLVMADTGPAVEVSTHVPGLSWKALAVDPRFKLAIFPECVRKILRVLVLNPGYRTTWGAHWLELEGIRGRDLPELEELRLAEAADHLDAFVQEACDGLLSQMDIVEKLGNSLESVNKS